MNAFPPDLVRRMNRRHLIWMTGGSLALALAFATLIFTMHALLHEITGFSSWPQAICVAGLFVLLVWEHRRFESACERAEDFDDE
jgi:hypothetical protein